MEKNKIKWIRIGIAFLVILFFPIIIQSSYLQHIVILIMMYAVLGNAWNIIGGYAGQFALGHAAFFGIGAYISTILYLWWKISPWFGMLIGGIISAVVGITIGYPCFKLRGHYFAMATLALSQLFYIFFSNWDLVGGAIGIYLPILDPSLINFQFHGTKIQYYYIIFGMLVSQTAVIYFMEKSFLGYYLRSIGEDQSAAQSLGVNINRYKLVGMGISSFFTAIAGTFYAQYSLFIDPESVFSMSTSVQMCLVTILGGVGNLWGPIIGSFVLISFSEVSRFTLGGSGKGIDLIIYGLLIVVISMFKPKGLMGYFEGNRI